MSNLTFAALMRERRRRTILEMLDGNRGYTLNSSNLHAGLVHLDFIVTRAEMLDDLQWLADKELLRLRPLVDGVLGCELTPAGHEVVMDMDTVSGVQRAPPRRL